MAWTSNGKYAIELEGVSLCFHIKRERSTSLKEAVVRKILRKEAQADCFWALQNVSFSIEKGEKVGVIGLNGSGKTTLLSLVAGIYQPDSGSVRTEGRIVGLLGLGAGFDAQMTGRENISLNASLYGLSSKEIAERTEAIIAFADIGEFIDLPVKTYSSGMGARLGFAVASHLDADVILLDEILAVGDAQFRQKCKARMQLLLSEHKTMMFVSHDLDSVKEMCSRVIWLDHGRLVTSGPTGEVLRAYQEKFNSKPRG